MNCLAGRVTGRGVQLQRVKPWARAFTLAAVLAGALVLAPPPSALAAEESGPSVVAVVRSDLADLPRPAPADAELSYPQIRDLVRRAADLGGLETVLRAAEAETGDDGPLDVVIKVNIVHTDPNPGDITDWRVAKAVIEAVHALSPAARVTIAEGGVWLPPERTDLIEILPFVEVADGFQKAGYRPLFNDPDLAGVKLDIVDLNFDEVVETPTPEGGFTAASYHLPRTVTEADVFIDVPVMKITGTVGMTVAMKNLIGIAPGMKYGWSKSQGFPPDSGSPGLRHSNETLDETIVDLTSVAGVDFTVVDAIVAMEKARITADGGVPVRMNTVVAGADIVSVDAVCARLMGMNPDDMEFITLADRIGLGNGRADRIRTVGQPLEQVARRFHKSPRDWGETGHYGQGNRLWILKGPVPQSDEVPPNPAVAPVANQDGWSRPTFFFDDRIDLDRYYADPVNCVAYAYADFTAPAGQEAHLWLGSDEDLRVWLNGEQVYDFAGSRRHHLPNESVPVTVREGHNTVLLRATQRRGGYDFSFKVCEPERDERYDGNALAGLQWSVPAPADAPVQEFREAPGEQERAEWWADHGVDLTQPARAWLDAYLPSMAQVAWIGLDEPIRWGWSMECEVRVEDEVVFVDVDNVRRLHLRRVGPLARLAGALTVEVNGLRLEPVPVGLGKSLALEATAVDTARGALGWRLSSIAPPSDEAPLAEAPAPLSRAEAPEGHLDTPLGNWFTDAIRQITGADVVFQNNGGIRTDLQAGPVEVSHLFEMNFPDAIYAFELTGEELLAVLEFDVRDAKVRPMQVSGVEYTFDPARPEGERIVHSTVEVGRTYTVAAEDYICLRSERFFGPEVDHRETGHHVVDCLVRYATEQGQIRSPGTGRIRQVSP